MRQIGIIFFILTFAFISNAQNNIAEARLMGAGKTVTVTGIVTNGAELGGIRYLQDETAGIAAYGFTILANVKTGDLISVSGTLKDYNNLLEIDPVTKVEIISSGNTLPEPKVITIDMIGEPYESQLIRINDVTFTNGGAVFEGNKNYNFFNEKNETATLRVNTATTSIVGQMIPASPIDIVTICSQFSYNKNETKVGYQLLPRSMDDFIVKSAILLTSPLTMSNLSKTGFTLSWTTNVAGTSEVYYGASANPLEWENKTTGTSTTTIDGFLHTVNLTSLQPGSIVYVKAFSVHKSDTASTEKVFATVSNSSGAIKVYFNTPVDTKPSKGVDAVYLNRAIDDTLIAYINRAKESIDFTIYNFNNNNLSNISEALNSAYKRGVKVRLISCGTAANLGLNDLDTEVPVLQSPGSGQRDGIMHNKFVVFDAHSVDPNVPLVWTGATNFTDGQINTDPNNVIIIQDQSLALTYEIEFNEMWGSITEIPSPENARFGAFKKDNTPHNFIIGGKQVECYFSPSDGTNKYLLDAIASAEHDLSIATMLITRTDIAYAIRDAKQRGVAVNILSNDKSGNTDAVNEILTSVLGAEHYVFDDVVLGIMHHKYAIIDEQAPDSDPILITGSHNWSAAANNSNDENTLIIHDETIANIYFQQFSKIFTDNNGSFFEIKNPPVAVTDTAFVLAGSTVVTDVLKNDIIESPISLSIEKGATKGNSFIPFTNPNVISYQASNNFVGTDTITYRITYLANQNLSATGIIIVNIGTLGIEKIDNKPQFLFFPNPAESVLNIKSTSGIESYAIYNNAGQLIKKAENLNTISISVDLSGFKKDLFIIRVIDQKGNTQTKQFLVK